MGHAWRQTARGSRLPATRAREAGPVATAVALGVIALPVVVWTLLIVPAAWQLENKGWVTPPIDWRPMSSLQAVALAAPAVLAAAVLGGWAGGRIIATHPRAGVFAAIGVAWAVGIIVVPA